MKLSLAALDRLPQGVSAPGYALSGRAPGIVHFGVGNFHRAHQAVYLDDLLAQGAGQGWAILGAGVRAADSRMRRALAGQDFLTTVVAQEAGARGVRVTAAMVGMLDPAAPQQVLAALADPAICIVSLTVTEGGYYLDPASGRFDPSHAELRQDAAAPQQPRTVFGLILAGLALRRRRGLAPFTVMSCDNIPGNGSVARAAVAGLARLSDPGLADWIEAEVAFPNSMVDRITPATTARERQLLADLYGLDDAAPVFCEAFRQWVVEDHFPAGRPPLERVGVQFIADVAPFETMKIRILNGGHAAIAYPSALLDLEFAHEAMQLPLIRDFLHALQLREILPVVPPVPGTDLHAYLTRIEARFANPAIGDTIARLCQDGADRQPKFILPSALDRLRQGAGLDGLALVSALWCRYCYGETESGREVPPGDAAWPRLTAQARLARARPEAWLEMTDLFGELATAPPYVAAFSRALDSLWRQGTAATLQAYLAAPG